MTGVPAFVLVQLINLSGRSSIAAEFMAGATPSWYQALPSPVKSGTYSAPAIPLAMTGSASTITGANAPVSTKPKGVSVRLTAASLSGAFGILGLAIAL